MRLIEAEVLMSEGTIRLQDFFNRPKPSYAILSHRWRDPEITFPDTSLPKLEEWPGRAFPKLRGVATQTIRDSLQYVWVDACCINKDSSAELSEAINSMFNWYKAAAECYVYLHDVVKGDSSKRIEDSDWFSRGWTLQELLAPSKVSFFDSQWQYLGDRTELSQQIANITGIDVDALRGKSLSYYSVAQRMSWAANRETTRQEDTAYCLLGLFNVNMPLLYGEGEKAFYRLQEEILKETDDHSIFAWEMGTIEASGLLAPSPHHFASCGQTRSMESVEGSLPFSMTNRGLSISLKITPWTADTYLANLECSRPGLSLLLSRPYRVCIFLRRLSKDDQYARVSIGGRCQWLDKGGKTLGDICSIARTRQVFVRKFINAETESSCLEPRIYGFLMPNLPISSSYQYYAAHRSQTHVPGVSAAVLHEGQSGPVLTIDLSNHSRGLKRITLGFDFDFNAICILEDSFSSASSSHGLFDAGSDWDIITSHGCGWHILHGGEIIWRKSNHDGVWALRGNRLDGLHAMLSEEAADHGAVVRLNHTDLAGVKIWEFSIDGLDGPFCNLVRSTSKGKHDNVAMTPVVTKVHDADQAISKESLIQFQQ